jgi:hypothetical protein
MVEDVTWTLLHREDEMMQDAQKIYTPRASLCVLGGYFHQEHVLDDFKTLPLAQKKWNMPPGKNWLMHLCSFWPEGRP